MSTSAPANYKKGGVVWLGGWVGSESIFVVAFGCERCGVGQNSSNSVQRRPQLKHKNI